MIVENGKTNVTTYFVLRDSTTHVPKADVTVTDIDLYYVEELEAIATKIDCTALSAATDAHTDGGAFNIGQGLYRIDWPDDVFDGGIGKRAHLAVVCSGVDTEFREVELSPAVDVQSWLGDDTPAAEDGSSFTAIPWNAAWNAEVQSECEDAIAASDGSSYTAVPWNADWDAQVESEATDALVAIHLDHLLATATGIPAIVAGTFYDQLVDDGTASFDRTTDSLQALRDNTGAAGAGLTSVAAQVLTSLGIVSSTVNDAGASTTVFITALTEATDNHYNGAFIVFTSGTLAGQSRKISDYDGATKTITLSTALTDAPANGAPFIIIGRSE